MVDEAMVVSAGKDGSLLVRVPAAKHDELLREPGAAQAEMGAGRTMGAGWIAVAAATVQSDDVLSSWIEVALAHRRTG